jgi:hypothetical protein
MESREIAMKSATYLLAGTASLAMLVSVAFAQDQAGRDQTKDQSKDQTGQVTRVNRLDNTIAIRPIQNGTVGANAAGAVSARCTRSQPGAFSVPMRSERSSRFLF